MPEGNAAMLSRRLSRRTSLPVLIRTTWQSGRAESRDGSSHPVGNDIYRRIMEQLKDRGVCIAVDAERDLLTEVLPLKPFLIKPNNHELGQIFGKELKTEKEIIDGAMSLKDRGAVNAIPAA